MKRVIRPLVSPAARITAALAFCVAAAFAISSSAAAANFNLATTAGAPAVPPTILAQAASTPAPAAAKPAAVKTAVKPSHVDRAEARIKDLHTRLKITAEQEAQWTQVAQVMRDNAKMMEDLIKARSENAKTMTAIDDLKSYGAITEAHAEGLKKFTPVFEALYDKMSDTQKKDADALFRRHGHRPSKSAT